MTGRKDAVLGMAHGTACGRLRKAVLFSLIQQLGLAACARCGGEIASAEELSLDHVVDWEGAEDPCGVFFDLDNVTFSHLACNNRARSKREYCAKGHAYTSAGVLERGSDGVVRRRCGICKRAANRDSMQRIRGRVADCGSL
jgi:hypothetical protein